MDERGPDLIDIPVRRHGVAQLVLVDLVGLGLHLGAERALGEHQHVVVRARSARSLMCSAVDPTARATAGLPEGRVAGTGFVSGLHHHQVIAVHHFGAARETQKLLDLAAVMALDTPGILARIG